MKASRASRKSGAAARWSADLSRSSGALLPDIVALQPQRPPPPVATEHDAAERRHIDVHEGCGRGAEHRDDRRPDHGGGCDGNRNTHRIEPLPVEPRGYPPDEL